MIRPRRVVHPSDIKSVVCEALPLLLLPNDNSYIHFVASSDWKN
jgi:hypothetical protein